MAAAQTRWVQIEARPTEAEAKARAQAWAGAFPDVAGFAMTTGWFAIVLGPYEAGGAAARLAELRADRLIPDDSFLADGRNFTRRIWPAAGASPVVTAAPPRAEPAARPVGAPDETLAEARAAEAALDRATREEIQTALAWLGYYTAAIDGAFGAGTRAAIEAWQRDRGAEATGVLRQAERAALLAEWRAGVAALGLEPVRDEAAGIAIDLPLGLVSFAGYDPPFVTYMPKDESGVQVLLVSKPGDQAALFALYAQIEDSALMPREGPRERRARSFEIRGADAQREAYAYAEMSGGLIKGYVVAWRPADAARMARVVAAMQASFRALGDRALDPALEPLDPAARAAMMTGLEPRRPARVRSGVFVDPKGAVLTAAEAVAGCGAVTIEGGIPADVALIDGTTGVALLRPRAALAPAEVAAAGPLPRPGGQVAVAGYPFGAALAAPVVTFGTFEAPEALDGATGVARARLAALPGDAGGAVLDAGGAMVGLLVPVPAEGGRVLPSDVAYLVPVAAFAPVLAAAGVTIPPAARAGARAPEDLTMLARALAVQVSCWE